MMRNTHLTIGIASAIAITNPKTVTESLTAIIGGVIGGLICDIDLLDHGYKNKKFFERFIAVKLTTIILFIDLVFQFGICEFILNRDRILLMIGGIVFTIVSFIGIKSPHRTFTHSFLGLLLFSLAFWFVYPPMVFAFAIGFLSHMLLDSFNKKKIRLFYPKEFGFCLGFCYADGAINKFLFYIGMIIMGVLLLNCLVFQNYFV